MSDSYYHYHQQDNYYSTHKVCICPKHIQDILNEYFMIYEGKIKNLINQISNHHHHDHQEEIYPIDIDLHERLYILWIGYFYELYIKPDSLFQIFWLFLPMDDNDTETLKYRRNVIWSKKIPAKFRFQCPRCNHIWTSKNGCVNVFICHHSPLYTTTTTIITTTIITNQFSCPTNIYEFRYTFDRQKCTSCSTSNETVSGSTYPHEVIKVLQYIRRHISVKPVNNNLPCHGFKIEFTDTYSSSTALNLTNSKDRNNLTLVKSTLPSVNYKNDLKGMATSKIDIVSNGNQQTPVESLPSIKDKTVQIQKNCTDKLTPVDEEFQKLSITVQQNQQLLEQHSKSDNYRNLSNAHLSTDLNKADDDDDNDNSNNKKDELMAELNNATKVVEVEMLVKDKPVQKQSQNCMSKKTPVRISRYI
uniref:Uncharacterized protein n=1 Tax=Trichobilharzia regenti TaxID=157069 RepID=A0AA85JLU6_TRIRE|nr:unnamed protein product [Trichobilharzia regenti]